MKNYEWLKQISNRIYREVNDDLYEDYFIDIGFMDDDEYISGMEKNILDFKR